MKKSLYILMLCICLSCSKSDTSLESDTETYSPCGRHTSGQQLYKGSKGGCYYINSNGKKTYVDRSECKC
ncbi:hypothetical protein [Pedobacter sp.]|uniref:hypothetical protein n=1 Tax=Pedobacter sp. TaxID=1411316 RepID=UPI0035662319